MDGEGEADSASELGSSTEEGKPGVGAAEVVLHALASSTEEHVSSGKVDEEDDDGVPSSGWLFFDVVVVVTSVDEVAGSTPLWR